MNRVHRQKKPALFLSKAPADFEKPEIVPTTETIFGAGVSLSQHRRRSAAFGIRIFFFCTAKSLCAKIAKAKDGCKRNGCHQLAVHTDPPCFESAQNGKKLFALFSERPKRSDVKTIHLFWKSVKCFCLLQQKIDFFHTNFLAEVGRLQEEQGWTRRKKTVNLNRTWISICANWHFFKEAL